MAESENDKVKKKLAKAKAEKKEPSPGVCYLASLPPYMKPSKLKSLLEVHGPVTKLYMAPEDESVRKKRKKAGGNSKQKYTEGWVQFKKKKIAKMVALKLNGQQIGGAKRNFYYYDTWNLKYLSGFKWEHLTEKMVYESKTRQARLRAEMAKTKKTNEYFLERVTKARAIEEIQNRKSKKAKLSNDSQGAQITKTPRRQFFQYTPEGKKKEVKRNDKQSELLKQIF